MSHLKQLYASNKTEHFNYIGGCGIYVEKHAKGKLAWAIDIWFKFISIVLLLKTVIATILELRNKLALNFRNYCLFRYLVLNNHIIFNYGFVFSTPHLIYDNPLHLHISYA